MGRIQLVSHKGLLLSSDTVQALTALSAKADANKWWVDLFGPRAGEEDGNPLSLIPAGREVHFRFVRSEVGEPDPQVALNALWGHAVPLGFIPWLRYPLVGPDDHIFHYFGPWVTLYDRLLAEGRGHLAWPSVCAAAQGDVGVWKGDKAEERFIQAQLHRIGRNCGPIDGVIGDRTGEAIESLGLARASFPQVVEHLRAAESPPLPDNVRKVGHVAIPGRQLSVTATGSIRVVKTQQGATLTIDGPGRVLVDVGGVT